MWGLAVCVLLLCSTSTAQTLQLDSIECQVFPEFALNTTLTANVTAVDAGLLLFPSIEVDVTCASGDYQILPLAIDPTFGFLETSWTIEVPILISPLRALMAPGSICQLHVRLLLLFALPADEQRYDIACTEVIAPAAPVEVQNEACAPLTAGLTAPSALTFDVCTTPAYATAATDDGVSWSVACTGAGTAGVGASGTVLSGGDPAGTCYPVAVNVDVSRDADVGDEVECTITPGVVALVPSGTGGEPIERVLPQTLATAAPPTTCAVAEPVPPDARLEQPATCGTLLLGLENVDALQIELCREPAQTSGANVTLGVRAECSDPRYHFGVGRDVVRTTFFADDTTECRTIGFTVALSGRAGELRSDAQCSFQALDRGGQPIDGQVLSVTCMDERLQPLPPTPAPTPEPNDTATPAPSFTPVPVQSGGGQALSPGVAATIAVSAIILAAGAGVGIYYCSRKPKQPGETKKEDAEDEPLLPTKNGDAANKIDTSLASAQRRLPLRARRG